MELIDKAALIAEIKKLRERAYELYGCSQFGTAYNNVLESIDTLEVKEVDFKERFTWKPSKEQIIALRWVLNNIPYNKHKEEISGLLDQIKNM